MEFEYKGSAIAFSPKAYNTVRKSCDDVPFKLPDKETSCVSVCVVLFVALSAFFEWTVRVLFFSRGSKRDKLFGGGSL